MPILSCRHCGKTLHYRETTDLPHFPFCGEKCKLLDLSDWFDERHRIQTNDPAPDTPEQSE